MEQIDVLKVENDKVGLAYLYAVIVRKIVFYPIANVTLNTTEIEGIDDVRLRASVPKHHFSAEAQQSAQL